MPVPAQHHLNRDLWSFQDLTPLHQSTPPPRALRGQDRLAVNYIAPTPPKFWHNNTFSPRRKTAACSHSNILASSRRRHRHSHTPRLVVPMPARTMPNTRSQTPTVTCRPPWIFPYTLLPTSNLCTRLTPMALQRHPLSKSSTQKMRSTRSA